LAWLLSSFRAQVPTEIGYDVPLVTPLVDPGWKLVVTSAS